MKAVLCTHYGEPSELVIGEAPDPVAGPGQVLIATRACGVNFPDVLLVQGKYQAKPEFPFIPGVELSGTVIATGEGVTHLRVGSRVVAWSGSGAFAEKVAVDAGRVFPMPQSMEFETAAGFLTAYATSHHALKDRAHLASGETLLVLGAAGGVGLTAVELGKLMGARVIAAASSEEKLALCKQYGADDLIDYSKTDLRERLKELAGSKGVDVVYDPVGDKYAEPAVRSLAFNGRYLVIGFAAGAVPRIPTNLLLLKEAAMLGVFWGAFAKLHPQKNASNVAELLDWYSQGKLRPHVSARYPLDQATQALEDLAGRRAQGKIVLICGDKS